MAKGPDDRRLSSSSGSRNAGRDLGGLKLETDVKALAHALLPAGSALELGAHNGGVGGVSVECVCEPPLFRQGAWMIFSAQQAGYLDYVDHLLLGAVVIGLWYGADSGIQLLPSTVHITKRPGYPIGTGWSREDIGFLISRVSCTE